MEWEYHYQFWQRHVVAIWAARQVAPEPSPWEVQKAANRLQRKLEKIESGKWLPRVPFKLNGMAKRQIREAHELLHETRDVLAEVKQ